MSRRPLLAATACLLLAGCKTRLPGYDADFGVPSDMAFLDLTIPKDNCGVVRLTTTDLVHADLLILQDRSRSMASSIGGLFGPSKWSVTRGAVEQVVSNTRSVDWGLMMFGDDGACGAPINPDVPVGPNTADAIKRALDAASPNSGTPTTGTVKNGLAWFQRLSDGHPHYMLLATDGEPRCGGGGLGGGDDSAAAEQALGDAAAAGVKTFVVGIGTSGGADHTLELMAQRGGVPNTAAGEPAYFPARNADELTSVLEKAALRITTCSYPLSPPPPDPDRVLVQGSQGEIPRDQTHGNGWDYSDGVSRIDFYGEACARLQDGTVTDVEVIYLCPDR
jgi:von Willebrand factor type A domain